MRVLKGRPIKLTHVFLDGEDVLPIAAVTVTLANPAGVTVATAAAVQDADGVWGVTLPLQPMGVYTATWNGVDAIDETPVEVVGNFLFSIPDVRKSDDYLADADAFPASEIAHYREVVESEFEKITSRSFTQRVQERTYVSDGSPELLALIPDAKSIESVSVNGVDVTDLSGYSINRLGRITTPLLNDGDVVTARIRYGFDTPPADVARVGMIRLRDLLSAESSAIPDRATTWQPQEGGTFRLATAGQGKWKTGIPAVDSTLRGYEIDTVLSVFGIG